MLTAAPSRAGDVGAEARQRLVGFVGFLRANAFGVAGGDATGVLDAAGRVGVLDREVLRWSLKALLCSRGEEWRRFDGLFDAYFLPPGKKMFEQRRASASGTANLTGGSPGGDAERPAGVAGTDPSGRDEGVAARHRASRVESLASTDFRDLHRPEDTRAIDALMRQFARRLKRLQLRREARAHQGRRLDLRGTIRKSVGSGGTPLRLLWKDRRRVRPRLVLLLDVSRSMSQYSFFYLRLARALCGELADVHCFIFHTRLTGISEALRDPDPYRAQDRMHFLAAGWAGGTRIGECLQDFTRDHGPRLVHSRTGVIIVSDGYDTGDPALLAGALATLGRRARRIVWINPLLQQPGFTPEARGMRAALPHLDLLAPGSDLAGIERMLPGIIDALR